MAVDPEIEAVYYKMYPIKDVMMYGMSSKGNKEIDYEDDYGYDEEDPDTAALTED